MKTTNIPFFSVNDQPVARMLVQNFVFCTGIALFLWKFVPSIGEHGFLSSFIYSQSIGNCICVMAIIATQLLRRHNLNSRLFLVVSITLISIVGAVIGLMIGTALVSKFIEQRDYFVDINNIVVSALIAVVASFLFNAFLGHRQNMLKLQLAASEESRRADYARHAMLQAQLEPHMLFNTLANLRALIHTDTDKAVKMLDRLDSFLRETLSSSNQRFQNLEHEFGVLDDYLALMKVRFGDRLHYSLNLDDVCKATKVPSLLLQPIVENAIKHGIEPQINGGEVNVTASCLGDKTVLTVADTGSGFSSDLATRGAQETESTDAGSGGFGLSNLKERLIQTYGTDAVINIGQNNQANATGTIITLTLPSQSESPK